jgi:hypothetical protein
MTAKVYVREQFQRLLIYLQIPLLYQRAVVWWEFHSDLRAQLKAARMFLAQRMVAVHNYAFGTVMIVATRQIQSRAELRDMSPAEIMIAYRSGRLDYLTGTKEYSAPDVGRYGDTRFRDWVAHGGQIKP